MNAPTVPYWLYVHTKKKIAGSERKSYGSAAKVFFFQIAQALRCPTIPSTPATQTEFVTKKTKNRAKRERELESPIRVSGAPPSARYARIASAIARACCAP